MAVDVSKHVTKAENAYNQRKYDLAIEIFLQSLEIDPDNRAARRGVRLAELKKAEHSYPSKLAIKVQTAPARMAMANPNPERKMSACEAYLKIDPKNTKVAHTLAATAEKAGYNNAAIGVYEAMITHAPKEETAYVALGRLMGPKEPDKAIEHLERALQLNPKNQEALKLRKDLAAELSIKRTGYETARTTHDLLRDKDQAKDLLEADRMQRTDDEAGGYIEKLQRKVAENPSDKSLLRQLAKAQAQSRQYEDAEDTWGKVLELDPSDFDARTKLGDLRIAKAQRALIEAQESGNEAAVAELGEKLIQAQITEFRTRIAEHPTDTGLRFQLGQVLLKSGDIDGAIGELQKSVKDPRKRFDSLSLLGECFLQKELWDLSARQLEKALAESPGLNSEQGKRVVYNLGLLRERQGKPAEARERFLQIYEVDVSYRDVAEKVTSLSG